VVSEIDNLSSWIAAILQNERMVKMEHKNYSNTFEERFREHSHYKKFDQMLPWVGTDYNKYKVLVIGESHYIPSESSIHLSSEKWYASSRADLNKEEVAWTNTAELITNGTDRKWESHGHTIYRNLENAIIESGFDPQDKPSIFKFLSYYNFFQRPAIEGKSLDFDKIDVQIATDVFKHVLKVIEPQIICFVSRKPWDGCIREKLIYWNEEKNRHMLIGEKVITVDYFPHPACRWWNRKSKQYQFLNDNIKRTGKEKFIDFIKAEEVFIKRTLLLRHSQTLNSVLP